MQITPRTAWRNVAYSGIILCIMEKQTVSFRLDSAKVDALDDLAKALDRDRTYLLNQAVESYLEIQQWQTQHIRASIKQADSGKFLDHQKVKRLAAKWRNK